ncbi:membrane integrity-associated transporter subunit PqiC [Duganella sp. FT3S]|uniref:Membrane integrity-associated transporter subunit PqiC n=2 Tax=Rugamonas fusca TaxID=2758568 RepID=A0A7W2EKA3_9BURK|nr:membrane integrity-associated transporter subunit PqiC [Rugamonas fusca]
MAAPPSCVRKRAAPLASPVALTMALTVALAGCTSPPPEHFYSLSSALPVLPLAATVPASGATAANATGAASTAAPYFIEVLAPSVPPQVARSQLVVTSGAGRIDLLEQERWAAPLGAELGQALSLALTARLGAIDVFRTPTPEHAAIYRISTSVQRFESAPGQYALLDVVWSVRLAGSPKVLTCRSELKEQVAPGYDALVAGHRRAVGRLADAIGAAVRRLASGGAGC